MEWFFTLSLGMQFLFFYLVLINIITFFYFGFDKMRAIKQRKSVSRVPEKVLWGLMCIGGTIGALGGMQYFRHKTKKASFQAMVLLILLLQISCFIIFLMQ